MFQTNNSQKMIKDDPPKSLFPSNICTFARLRRARKRGVPPTGSSIVFNCQCHQHPMPHVAKRLENGDWNLSKHQKPSIVGWNMVKLVIFHCFLSSLYNSDWKWLEPPPSRHPLPPRWIPNRLLPVTRTGPGRLESYNNLLAIHNLVNYKKSHRMWPELMNCNNSLEWSSMRSSILEDCPQQGWNSQVI